ncbi:hypothetical protein DS745_22195 [Anaerobacillus alkaliphilus]|uniref:BshB3 potential contributor to bacillithiol synthesis n=1 Tax=Anaerobacillus alkaliphilus TaxID=1548597 RepID=A0A4Q0VN75_9BACI|nr:hypothetical protein [Anaerobacillus alkaliphilus]RXI96426.1 hypothetical protein DS745_22195 [Anaerobacillus alkaliphilus]
MNILIIVSAIICIFALVATILVGIKPHEENYGKTTKKRLTRLTVIYFVTFVPALIFVFIYFGMK